LFIDIGIGKIRFQSGDLSYKKDLEKDKTRTILVNINPI